MGFGGGTGFDLINFDGGGERARGCKNLFPFQAFPKTIENNLNDSHKYCLYILVL